MKSMSLYELYKLRDLMIRENFTDNVNYISVCEKINTLQDILEDTSATGGPSIGGMGAVVSAQPSGLAGQTIGTNWASNGGTTGSGDVSVPYNPSGSNRVFQKIPVMGYNHGARTGKKSRTKKLDLKSLKNSFNKRKIDNAKSSEDEVSKPREKKVMSFDDFQKSDINNIKR